MGKISNPKKRTQAFNNDEDFILNNHLVQHDTGNDLSMNLEELMENIGTVISSLLNQAIEALAAQSLIHCSDGKNYIIALEGIDKVANRKRERQYHHKYKNYF